MTNTKKTKSALLASVVALFLCFAMLLGTTFAWFTDSVTSANNIITAGNLNIELYHTDKMATEEKVNGNTKLFDDVALWEPGAVAYETFKIANEGTLALKYQLAVNVANATKTANGGTLADVLKVGVIENGATATTREEMIKEVTTWNSLASFALPGDLERGEADTYTVVIYWQPSDVDNAYNMNNGEAALTIDIGVNLYATQKMSENDSFGSDYDAEAPMPEVITTADDLAAALTANEKEITVALYADMDLPISSLGQQTGGSGEYKLGGEDTESIVIDLNGHKLNITTTYWSNIGAKNADATMTIKNGTMTSSQPTGTWNSYDLTFSNCNYVFENVTFDKAVALANTGKSVEMTNVTINETHDYYALWICAEGMDVEINGLTINSLGRGIKIDEQYSDAPAKVTLNVTNADFNTAKKAAIMVKSVAGADIVLDNVDIAGVASDPFNEVWVDEDAAAYADLVTVTGGTVVVEGSADVPVMANPSNVQDCIKNAVEGATVVLTAGTYEDTIVMKSNITLLGTDGAVVYCVNLNGSENVTIKNVAFDAAGAKSGYNGSGTAVQPANIVTGTATNNPSIGAHNVLIENCTFTGAFVDGGGSIAFMDQSRSTGGSGNITIKGCTFETTGGYFDIYAYYSGDNSAFVIENNTFASVCYNPIYFGRYQSSTPVVVKGNTFETVTDFSEAAYIQAHSSNYTVSFDAADNTFNG